MKVLTTFHMHYKCAIIPWNAYLLRFFTILYALQVNTNGQIVHINKS